MDGHHLDDGAQHIRCAPPHDGPKEKEERARYRQPDCVAAKEGQEIVPPGAPAPQSLDQQQQAGRGQDKDRGGFGQQRQTGGNARSDEVAFLPSPVEPGQEGQQRQADQAGQQSVQVQLAGECHEERVPGQIEHGQGRGQLAKEAAQGEEAGDDGNGNRQHDPAP